MATNNLDKLTKSIDALTYNSRSVLNALIRSCIAAGSSSGYKVIRYGKEITLTRTDIYKLYDFYQTWANGTMGYVAYTSDADEFSAILAACNAKWSGDSTVTAALVKHAQIVYTTKENAENESAGYWTDLIRNSTTPKLVVNSAPIPLNLRTPLYDENLSTKSFSQYETYLFPMGYYQAAILGMPGDDESRTAAGRNWLFDVDDTFKVNANHIILGSNNNTVVRQENYKDAQNTLSYGIDCYALADGTISGGFQNVSLGKYSSTVGGYYNIALANASFIGGGISNVAGDSGAAVAGGLGNSVLAENGFAANKENFVGDYAYPFTVDEAENAGTQTDCTTIKDATTGTCTVSSTSSALSDPTGRNALIITLADVNASGLGYPRINTGDRVAIFAQTRKSNGKIYQPYGPNGYTYPVWYYTVTNVEYDKARGVWKINIDGNLPAGDSVNSMWVNGGMIARAIVNLREISYDGTLSTQSRTIQYGINSNALNYRTIAAGLNQTVVGQMNSANVDAKFIVGVGSSYVTGANTLRRNGLVIAEGYSYMQTANRNAIIGVSEYNGIYYRDYDGNNIRHGAFMMYDDGKYAGEASVASYYAAFGLAKDGTAAEDNFLKFCRSGSSYLSSTHDVTVMLESRAGTLVISAGSYVSGTYNADVLLKQGPLFGGENGLAVYSADGIDIRNTNPARIISIHNSGYISMTYSGLLLHGDTWGALSATDSALSFFVGHPSDNNYTNPHNKSGHCVNYPNTITHSGFFYGINDGKSTSALSYAPFTDGYLRMPPRARGDSWESGINGMHIINSAVPYGDGKSYDVSGIIIPGMVPASEKGKPPHVKVFNSKVYGTGNSGIYPTETYLTEELAYMSDLDKAGSTREFAIISPFAAYKSPEYYAVAFSGYPKANVGSSTITGYYWGESKADGVYVNPLCSFMYSQAGAAEAFMPVAWATAANATMLGNTVSMTSSSRVTRLCSTSTESASQIGKLESMYALGSNNTMYRVLKNVTISTQSGVMDVQFDFSIPNADVAGFNALGGSSINLKNAIQWRIDIPLNAAFAKYACPVDPNGSVALMTGRMDWTGAKTVYCNALLDNNPYLVSKFAVPDGNFANCLISGGYDGNHPILTIILGTDAANLAPGSWYHVHAFGPVSGNA